MIAEKNIFLRDRTRYEPSTRSSSNVTTRHEPTLEETLVLTGIVFEDDGFRAYVEDVPNEKILKLALGDSVAHGKIDAIEIDAVSYDMGGKQRWIEIGSDFTGKPYLAFSDSSSSSSGSTSSSFSLSPSASGGSSSSQPAVNPNDPNLTVEQRMRLRAQQEQQRGRR
ncbi:MAG TPA: hypothetical protein VL282_10305 [Tepidisphaeraceae bacterium]|nr:hypothetical protein [Tepidisphaeraceae bacterium]